MRLVLLLVSCSSAAFPWGPTGHRAVALIAHSHLSPKASAQVRELLGGQSMADASTWADEVRPLPNWSHSAPWHYVNIDDDDTYKASKKNPAGDVLSAIARFRKDLARRRNPPARRADALRFLIHFIGDLHQPLHAGRAADRGGNSVNVTWFGSPSDLHRVWDSGILDRENLRDIEWAARLSQVDARQHARWIDSSPLDWANESFALRENVYAIGDGKLDQRYHEATLPIVRQRLLQAGLRLAAFLESALD